MSKTKSATLRVNLTQEDMTQLVKIADICGDDVAVTARKAIQSLIAYAHRHAWKISFPIVVEAPAAEDELHKMAKRNAA